MNKQFEKSREAYRVTPLMDCSQVDEMEGAFAVLPHPSQPRERYGELHALSLLCVDRVLVCLRICGGSSLTN
jgi:hypothetical protein